MPDEVITIDDTDYMVIDEHSDEIECYDRVFRTHAFDKREVNFEKKTVCCFEHDMDSSPYPSGECPYCEMERHRDAMREHEMTRNPEVEPW